MFDILMLVLFLAALIWVGKLIENQRRLALRKRHPEWFVSEDDS